MNAVGPFVVISAIGLMLSAVVPARLLTWVFIPTVVNAAAAGDDFIAMAWLIRRPASTVFEDDGERPTAYQLPSTDSKRGSAP